MVFYIYNSRFYNDHFLPTFPYFSLSLWTFFRSPSRRIFLPIYSYLDCIVAFHSDGCWSFLRYLSHHCLVGGDGVGCRLQEHCSWVILLLMRLAKLVWCIKWGGDVCFIWKLPPSLACMSLLPSSAFNIMALMVYLRSLENCLLFGRAILPQFPWSAILTGWGPNWWIVGLSCPLGGLHLLIPSLRASPSHNIDYYHYY